MSIIKHVTLQKIVAHDFRYDPRKYGYELKSEDSGREYGREGKTEMENRVLVGKHDGKRQLARSRQRWRIYEWIFGGNLHGSKQEKEVGSCDCNNELRSCPECSEFIDHPRN